jgi:hypothetical protein
MRMGSGKRIGRRNRLRADAQFNKPLNENLCCCCGLFVATKPNGLCKDCADHCAGFLLKDKPCITTNLAHVESRAEKEARDEEEEEEMAEKMRSPEETE